MTIASRTPPRTTSEYIAKQLREDILSGAFRMSEHLRQNHIAGEFGVSSTPVREALRELAAEGLILSSAHRGNIVRGLTISEFGGNSWPLRRIWCAMGAPPANAGYAIERNIPPARTAH